MIKPLATLSNKSDIPEQLCNAAFSSHHCLELGVNDASSFTFLSPQIDFLGISVDIGDNMVYSTILSPLNNIRQGGDDHAIVS
ncbi:hypothetical protein [Scytonema sp. PCC 10023]|uniref:hypothetical protein n=1 Tax=Scytonema sp. PCC 10023 TaxID=1680591 RepID=UPI0039C60A3E